MKSAISMEFFHPFLAAFVILQESIKLLPKNAKLIVLTVVPSLVIYSLLLLAFNISSKPILDNISVLSMSLAGGYTPEFSSVLSHLNKDIGILFVIELAFFLACMIILLLSITATILISAISKTDKTLSSKDFALLVVRTFVRPLITGFYTFLLGLGYSFLLAAITAPILMFSDIRMGRVPYSIILYGVCAYISYLYLSMTWILSLVVSVVEQKCYGIEALGKAGGLIKGKRFQGFILSAFFAVFSLVVLQGLRIIIGNKWVENATVLWVVVLNFSSLVKMFVFVTYTVLYFHCKKHHGEEIELQGGTAEFYDKISNAPLVDDMA